MGIHPLVLVKSFPITMAGFRWFSKLFAFFCHGRKSSLSMERVKRGKLNKLSFWRKGCYYKSLMREISSWLHLSEEMG